MLHRIVLSLAVNAKTSILNNNKKAGYYESFVSSSVASYNKVQKIHYNV